MKTLYHIILLTWLCVPVKAQESGKEDPPRKIASPKDRIVVDFSFDSWTAFPSGVSQKPYSLGGNAYLMWDYPVGYGPLSIAFGAGFSTHNVHHNAKIVYSLDGRYTSFVPLTTTYKTNKLSCNYVEMPLELRIRARGGHKFKMAIGGKIGYLYNIHTKEKDADGKRKIYDIRNVDPLRYGLTFRIGYNRFNLQGFYALSELFLKGRGEPGMFPFSAGIGLLLY